MARDTDSIILIKYANSGDVGLDGLDLNELWDISYSTPGGIYPKRIQFNQLFRYLSALAVEINQKGPFLEYSDLIFYSIGATVLGSDGHPYKAVIAQIGNDPVGDDQTNWIPETRTIAGVGSPSVISGDPGNSIASGINSRANVIAGGGYSVTGQINRITGPETRYAIISGGYDNFIDGDSSTTDIDGAASTIGGGAHHVIKCTHATISGGSFNEIGIDSDYGTICGGTGNEITDNAGLSTILGGANNTANQPDSLVWGKDTTADCQGSFVLNRGDDGTPFTGDVDFSFIANFANYILSGGKVGIGSFPLGTPITAQLDIALSAISATPGVSLMQNFANRFGFRFSTDTELTIDRNSGGWQSDPVLTMNRSDGRLSIGIAPETARKLRVFSTLSSVVQVIQSNVAGAFASFVDSTTGDSTMVRFGASGNNAEIYANGLPKLVVSNTAIRPANDNAVSAGDASYRYSEIFSVNPTINTSDEREKEFIGNINDTEKLIALEIKGHIKSFKWVDAINKKGDSARIHFGVGAQTVADCFENHGLNASDYGMFCYDEWEETTQKITKEIKDKDGNITLEEEIVIREAGNRYGIRYDELLCFVIAAL